MDEREKLSQELLTLYDTFSSKHDAINKVADFILEDRKRIVQPLLNHMQNKEKTFGEGRQKAIDETLKLAGVQ